MSKRFKGYLHKTSSRIIAGSILTGVVVLGVTGGSIIHKLSNREEAEHPYDEATTEVGYLETEDTVETETAGETYNPEETFPELKDPITDNNNEEVVLGAEFTDVLAKLTAKSREYIETFNGASSNITVSGISSIKIDSNKGLIVIAGQAKLGDRFSNYKSSVTNSNTALKIYTLQNATDISETDLVNALSELLDSEQSKYELKLFGSVVLSNQQQIAIDMLNARLASLEALNSTDTNVIAEINYINKLLDSNKNLYVNLVLNNTVFENNEYKYSFTTVLNTSKYTYSCDYEFTSSRNYAANNALKHTIENHIASNEAKVNMAHTSQIDNGLYLINSKANELQQSNTLNQ